MSGILADNTGRASGLLKAAGGGGKVLQVVQNTFTGTASNSGTSYDEVTTSFRGVITPTLATSKILVFMAIVGSASGNYGWASMYRLIAGGSDAQIAMGDASGSQIRTSTGQFQQINANQQHGPWTVVWLDAPSTALEVTYKLFTFSHSTFYLNRPDSSADLYNVGKGVSTFTMMEIDNA